MIQRGIKKLYLSQSAYPVAGRLKHFQPNWACVSQDRWILGTVQGYKIKWIEAPFQNYAPRQGVVFSDEQNLVWEEIESMLQKGAITQPTQQQAKRVFLEPIPGSQKRWWHETSDKLETTQPIHPTPSFQDGGDPYPKGSPHPKIN